jgi:hypothetical protein
VDAFTSDRAYSMERKKQARIFLHVYSGKRPQGNRVIVQPECKDMRILVLLDSYIGTVP